MNRAELRECFFSDDVNRIEEAVEWPKKEWEVAVKHWTKLADKNVTFGGKYLAPFNP